MPPADGASCGRFAELRLPLAPKVLSEIRSAMFAIFPFAAPRSRKRPPMSSLRIFPLWIAFAATAALVVAGCDASGSGGPGPGDPGAGPIAIAKSGPYSLHGDTVVSALDSPSVRVTCIEGRSTPQRDSVAMVPVRWVVAVEGDTLKLGLRTLAIRDSAADPARVAATIETWDAYLRTGGSSGLEGVWRAIGPGFRVLSGVLPASYSPPAPDPILKSGLLWATFTFQGGRLTETGYSRPAPLFKASQTGEISTTRDDASPGARYDIGFTVVDDRHLRMEGRKTGEVVDIEWTDSSTAYASSVPAHGRHVWSRAPVACPNDFVPPWLASFLGGNLLTP